MSVSTSEHGPLPLFQTPLGAGEFSQHQLGWQLSWGGTVAEHNKSARTGPKPQGPKKHIIICRDPKQTAERDGVCMVIRPQRTPSPRAVKRKTNPGHGSLCSLWGVLALRPQQTWTPTPNQWTCRVRMWVCAWVSAKISGTEVVGQIKSGMFKTT